MSEKDVFTTSDREALQELAIAIGILKEQIASLKDPLNRLVEIVQIGNGKNSLITRITMMEDDTQNLQKKFDKLEKNNTAKEVATTNSKYMLYAALVTGSFGTLGIVIDLLIKFFKN